MSLRASYEQAFPNGKGDEHPFFFGSGGGRRH